MKKAFVAAMAVLLVAGISFAATIEYDLDGIPGNGPDVINVPVVGTVVNVDIWIYGPPASCWVWGTFMCNPDHSLVYVSPVTYYTPGGGWGGVQPQPADPNNCITVQAQNFAGDVPITFPYKVATVKWQAAVDHSIDTLVSGAGSGILTPSFGSMSYSNNEQVLGTIKIGTVATEETNWGAVKTLFR